MNMIQHVLMFLLRKVYHLNQINNVYTRWPIWTGQRWEVFDGCQWTPTNPPPYIYDVKTDTYIKIRYN